MKRIEIPDIILWLVLIAFSLTPIFSIGEITSLLRGTLTDQSTALTPFYIKGLKDVFFALIIFVSSLSILKRGRASFFVVPFAIFLGMIALLFFISYHTNPIMAFAGLRWITPLIAAFFLIGYADERMQRKIARISICLLFIHFAAQVYELFYMSRWFGTNLLGLAARVPGIFFMPNTAGFFSCVILYYLLYHYDKGKLRALAIFLIIPITILLTMSATAILFYLASLVVYFAGRKYGKIMIYAAPLVLLVLFPTSIYLTGRDNDYFKDSFGTRLNIFQEHLSQPKLVSDVFGAGTESAAILLNTYALDIPAARSDSFYAGFMVNTGVILSLLFLAGYFFWGVGMLNGNRPDLFVFTILYTLFAATNSVVGAFPMNLLFAVSFAFYLKDVYIPFVGLKRGIGNESG